MTKKDCISPTTPGLNITFNNLIVETICLNMEPKLGPKFWSQSPKYWGPKYVREISRGIQIFRKLFGNYDLDNPTIRIAIIRAITNTKSQSLLVKKTRLRIFERFLYENTKLLKDHETFKKQEDTPIDQNKNSRFVDLPQTTPLGKIREIEKYG